MRDTAIVIDADACVPPTLVDELNLIVAPPDAPPLSRADTVAHLARDAWAIAAEPVAQACAAAAEQARAVLYVAANDGYGSAAEAGALARAAVAARVAGTRFVEYDAHATLMGAGWQAVAAARAVAEGLAVDDAVAAAARVGAGVNVLAFLEHPELSGVGGANVPGTARLRAIVALRGAEIDVLARPAKREDGLVVLRDRFATLAREGGPGLHVAVHHAAAAAGAEALATWIRRTLAPDEIVIAPLTRHAAARLGPRMLGLAWYHEPG